MKEKKKILAVTGSRSEYDILYPLLNAAAKHPAFSIELIVTGAHLSKSYGYTIAQIKKDKFKIADEIESLINGDQKSSRVKGVAIQLAGIVQTIARVNPSFLLVVGDREEAITTALAAIYMDIPLVHLCGGDKVVGNVDDVIRHAVTKLAHIHFVTNEESGERIRKLGEEPFRIHNVGHPGLDRFRGVPFIQKEDVMKLFGFEPADTGMPLLLVVQHVLSSEMAAAYQQMKETMEAVSMLNYPTVVTYPNSDSGSQEIIRCIKEYQQCDFIRIRQNIPRFEFGNLLRHASCLIGNSSLGILEAPFFKLPTINVGNRQKGRLHGKNVVFIPHNRNQIKEWILKACFNERFIATVRNGICPYGKGDASEKILDILTKIRIDAKLLIKEISY